MNAMEKNEAGRNPLIERRLDNLEKRTDNIVTGKQIGRAHV